MVQKNKQSSSQITNIGQQGGRILPKTAPLGFPSDNGGQKLTDSAVDGRGYARRIAGAGNG
jgi:hypothetical protein